MVKQSCSSITSTSSGPTPAASKTLRAASCDISKPTVFLMSDSWKLPARSVVIAWAAIRTRASSPRFFAKDSETTSAAAARKRAPDRARFPRLPGEIKRARSGRAVVVDVDYRDAGEPERVQRRLAAGRIAVDVADVGLLDRCVLEARIFERQLRRARAHHVVGIASPRLGERHHADARDQCLAHGRYSLSFLETSPRAGAAARRSGAMFLKPRPACDSPRPAASATGSCRSRSSAALRRTRPCAAP